MRLLQLILGEEDIVGLPHGGNIAVIFQVLSGVTMQGLMNAFAYGLTPAVRTKWKGLWDEVI